VWFDHPPGVTLCHVMFVKSTCFQRLRGERADPLHLQNYVRQCCERCGRAGGVAQEVLLPFFIFEVFLALDDLLRQYMINLFFVPMFLSLFCFDTRQTP